LDAKNFEVRFFITKLKGSGRESQSKLLKKETSRLNLNIESLQTSLRGKIFQRGDEEGLLGLKETLREAHFWKNTPD